MKIPVKIYPLVLKSKLIIRLENKFNILFTDSIDKYHEKAIEYKNITSTRHICKIDTFRNSDSKESCKVE